MCRSEISILFEDGLGHESVKKQVTKFSILAQLLSRCLFLLAYFRWLVVTSVGHFEDGTWIFRLPRWMLVKFSIIINDLD
jgi:hypothetical protein